MKYKKLNNMSDNFIFWICIIVAVLGLASIFGIFFFGQVILRNHILSRQHPQHLWDDFLFRYLEKDTHRREDLPRHLISAYSDYLERRNEFWTTFGQVMIALVIVVILSILLLTKAISAEAGLPILSGISGFAIAKGVSGAKSINIPYSNKNIE